MSSITVTDSKVKTRLATKVAKRSRRANDNLIACLLLAPAALLLGAIVLLPFFHVITMSFQRINAGDLSGPWNGISNYLWALASPDFSSGLINTLIWTGGTVFGEMALGLLFALALNQPLKMRGLARAITLFSYLVPTIVAVLVWRYMFHDLVGIINHMLMTIGAIRQPLLWLEDPNWAMPSVIFIGAWKHFPFVVLILLAMLQNIPKEQYEAASIDGARPFQQFVHVTLPALLPVLFVTAIIRMIYNINSFDIIYLLTGGGPVNATTTLPVLIYNKAFVDFQVGRAGAVAILMFLIMLIPLALHGWFTARSKAYDK
ncbi:carbohydrate ABC transporter permease [Neorhizobium sp. DT-125]|uniref:carbohydrate ABC transporter permease n=1 Tax=Neorhizobium sp. DT-125 TaxID=3396163 RepID=UPI003F1A045C